MPSAAINGVPVTHTVGPYGLHGSFDDSTSASQLVYTEAFGGHSKRMVRPVFSCSFETGSVSQQPLVLTTVAGDAPSLVTSPTAHTGTTSARFNRVSGTGAGFLTCTPTTNVKGAGTISFWFYLSSLPTGGDAEIAEYNTTGSLAVSVRCTTAGNITLVDTAGTTTVATAVSTGAWHQLELSVISGQNPWIVSARVDGKAISTHTVANASQTLSSVTIGSTITGSTTHDFLIDDFVVFNGYELPGTTRVEVIRPDATVSNTGWTANPHINTGDDNTGTAVSATAINDAFVVDLSTYTPATNDYVAGLTTSGVGGATAFGGSDETVELYDSDGPLVLARYVTSAFALSGAILTQPKYNMSPVPDKKVGTMRIKTTHANDGGVFHGTVTELWVELVVINTTPIAQSSTVLQGLTAALSFTSAQTRKAKRVLTATLSFTSAQTRKVKAVKTATLSFTSAQTRRMKKTLTATLSFTSAQTRKAKKALTASWSGSGSLTQRIAIRKSLGGALSFTSAQTKKVKKPVTATLSFSSGMLRRVRKFVAAAGSFTGSLTKRVRKTLTASVGFSGTTTQIDVPSIPYSPPGMMWIQRWRRKRRT